MRFAAVDAALAAAVIAAAALAAAVIAAAAIAAAAAAAIAAAIVFTAMRAQPRQTPIRELEIHRADRRFSVSSRFDRRWSGVECRPVRESGRASDIAPSLPCC